MKWLIPLLISLNCYAQSNLVQIEQIGINNIYSISQDGFGHSATLTLGKDSSQDSTSVTVTQQGFGAKTATVELPSGYSNTVSISQDGSGAHATNILTFSGAGNSISVNQSGASNNTFNLNGTGTNNANTITATQTGNLGADKSFTLNMTNTIGATVNVQQTNMSTSNSGSMTINCSSLCGTYSYIRN